MDPTENLKEQLRLAKFIIEKEEKNIHNFNSDEIISAAVELSDLVLALNNWIDKGGFYPKQWSRIHFER